MEWRQRRNRDSNSTSIFFLNLSWPFSSECTGMNVERKINHPKVKVKHLQVWKTMNSSVQTQDWKKSKLLSYKQEPNTPYKPQGKENAVSNNNPKAPQWKQVNVPVPRLWWIRLETSCEWVLQQTVIYHKFSILLLINVLSVNKENKSNINDGTSSFSQSWRDVDQIKPENQIQRHCYEFKSAEPITF